MSTVRKRYSRYGFVFILLVMNIKVLYLIHDTNGYPVNCDYHRPNGIIAFPTIWLAD